MPFQQATFYLSSISRQFAFFPSNYIHPFGGFVIAIPISFNLLLSPLSVTRSFGSSFTELFFIVYIVVVTCQEGRDSEWGKKDKKQAKQGFVFLCQSFEVLLTEIRMDE